MIMPVALLLVKLVMLDRMVSMYRVCRWFGYLPRCYFFFAKSAAPVTTSFPRQFAGKTQHRQLLLTQGSWWILIVCGILINCITSSQWSLYDRVGHFSTGGHGLCEFSLRYVAEHYYTYCSRYNNMSLPSNYNVRVNNCIVTCWSTVNCQQFICLLTMVTTNQCC